MTIDRVKQLLDYLRLFQEPETSAEGFQLIAAAENLGDHDESLRLLLLKTASGQPYTIYGGHCSCHGFEGQWKPQRVTWKWVHHECEREGGEFSSSKPYGCSTYDADVKAYLIEHKLWDYGYADDLKVG